MTEFTTLLQQGNAWFFIPSAILLGALHGLEPGHSKTMMAAFIIAIKGTIKQAVMLGLAATISHTAVVWLIAFGGMVISKRFTAQSAEPWLQLISAVIIISTAFWMFWRTWRGERNWLENMHEYDHEHHHHDHEDHHDHGHHHHHEHGEYQDAHARAHANDIKRRFDGREVTNWQILLFGL
ncbi:nickel/cobalt efflux protein RcnA, partial [Vibrio sp. 1408]